MRKRRDLYKVIKYSINILLPFFLMNLLACLNSLITDYVKMYYRFFYGCFVIWPFVWAAVCMLALIPIVSWNNEEPSLRNTITLIVGVVLLLLPAIMYVAGIGFYNRLWPYFSYSINTVSMPVTGIFTCAYIYLIIRNFKQK